jgi:cysteine desulfurase
MAASARLYADHNATSPLRACALAAAADALRAVGNPSSIHAEGRAARARVEEARGAVAALGGAEAANVVFTSGASEAAALALTPALGCETLIRFAGEHACVAEGGRFAARAMTIAPSARDGRLDLDALAAMLATMPGRPMLALQAANNETGVIQPVAEAAALVKARGGVVVCDAAQAAGRIEFSLEASGADWALVSSHKLGGPPGAGALIGRGAFPAEAALVRGGGQERGARAGTQNAPALAGFGAAAREALAAAGVEASRLGRLRDGFEAAMRARFEDVEIVGESAARLPQTSCLILPGLSAQTVLMALDLAGVAASSGSACASGKVGVSATLAAMAIPPERAAGALRFSFGWSTTAADVEHITEIVVETTSKLLARRSRSAA